MAQEYHTQDNNPSPDRLERRGVSRKTVIEAAKEAVPTIDLADRLCGPGGLQKVGDRWVGRCPLPGHKDRSPSFTVNPEKNLWYCFGACQRGGDVIELARCAWDYEKSDAAVVAAYLLMEFGYEVPPRPASWFGKQKRQQDVRAGLNEVKVSTAQRRLFRLFEGYLSRISDPDMRREEANAIFSELYPIARMVVARMEGRNT
jgi:DNA primase